ncbi:aldehyde dehydrogenase family protein [Nocardia vaccinii]|uniref:aldehyde dehydrogenase family protein n=1 Tax=Nocardia vaccinii TaxID=1822 RepID=UPI000B02D0FD|nr:aldehyde dehydrogenase family protein [Nocardia vaccinii]
MLIGGKLVSAVSGAVDQSLDPYTGAVVGTYPAGTSQDVDLAVTAAVRAFESSGWAMDVALRVRCLRSFADLIDAHVREFAVLESSDNGKPIREVSGSIGKSSQWYRYAASLAETFPFTSPRGADPSVVSVTMREPYGVVGVQVPWNSPSVLFAQVASMCLGAGNTLVVKPSELAPCSLLALAELFSDAGFPAGVVNIISGDGVSVGAALCDHPQVAKLAFTGGPQAGRIVAGKGAERLVPSTLELGGKSANLVFPDADLDRAVAAIAAGITSSSGQSCVAGSRAVVHVDVFDEMTERLESAVVGARVGDPRDPRTDVGPLIGAGQCNYVAGLVDRARCSGARVVEAGGVRELGGNFYPPTVVSDIEPDAEIAQKEVFGPVLVCLAATSEADAVRIANNTPYGLAAGVWTRDLSRAFRVSRDLRAGSVWVNQYRRTDPAYPFGGYGESGYGRVSGIDGFTEMTRAKSVQIKVWDD